MRKLKKKMVLLILLLVCICLLGHKASGGKMNGVYEQELFIREFGYIQKGDALDSWINRLARNENCYVGVKGGELVGTWDNGSYSYGALCYKRGTFIMFVKKFNLLPEATDDEIMNQIGDVRFQKQLTRLVMEDSWNNWSHWFTTTKYKIGYPPK
jgi:hypothetical protein